MHTLFSWYGSAVPRALPFSLLSAAVAGVAAGVFPRELAGIWGHPYPYQAFAFVVGFLIVFRCVSSTPPGQCSSSRFEKSAARRITMPRGATAGARAELRIRCES